MSAIRPAQTRMQFFIKNWWRAEILPIVVVVGTACGGASWYLYRLARSPDVVWDRHNNPYPWRDLANARGKLMSPEEKFTRKYQTGKAAASD